MRSAFAWLLVGLTVFAFPAQADAVAIESAALDNGLEIIVIPNHRVPAVSHMLWYRVGSADDPPGKSGLAHFHEHVMFKGTARYTGSAYSDIIARYGGEQNAFTGYDATSYYINIAKEHLPLAMELESDRMRGLAPRHGDIDSEKQVILEERRQRIENSPGALMNEQVNAALFRHHPYRIPVIGWMHEMEGLSRDDALQFHHQWYRPNNAILIVSGDATMAEVKPLAERYYGSITAGKTPARLWNAEPPHIAARRLTLRHANVKQPECLRSYMASGAGYGRKEDMMPLLVLSQILAGGKSSRLYRELVVERKLASGVDVRYNGLALGPAEFALALTLGEKTTPDALEGALDETLRKFLADGISDEELARAKTQMKAESVYVRDGLAGTARVMGWLRIAGLEAEAFNRWDKDIDAVSKEGVLAAAKATLHPDASVTGWMMPQEKTL